MPLCSPRNPRQANTIKADDNNSFAKAKAAVAIKAGAAPRRFGTALSVNSNTSNSNAIAPAPGKAAPRKQTTTLPTAPPRQLFAHRRGLPMHSLMYASSNDAASCLFCSLPSLFP